METQVTIKEKEPFTGSPRRGLPPIVMPKGTLIHLVEYLGTSPSRRPNASGLRFATVLADS